MEKNIAFQNRLQIEKWRIKNFLQVRKQASDTMISNGEPTGNTVKSPLVGTFYAAPSEDAPAFVKWEI